MSLIVVMTCIVGSFIAGMVTVAKRVNDSFEDDICLLEQKLAWLQAMVDAHKSASDRYYKSLISSMKDSSEWRRLYFDKCQKELPRPHFFCATVPITQQYKRRDINWNVRQAIYSRDNHECLKCGSKDDLSIDHIVPVAKGGTNDFDNLQTLCFSCNSKKRTKIIDYRASEMVA